MLRTPEVDLGVEEVDMVRPLEELTFVEVPEGELGAGVLTEAGHLELSRPVLPVVIRLATLPGRTVFTLFPLKRPTDVPGRVILPTPLPVLAEA